MCGISGIISMVGGSVSEQDIRRMNDVISHRGPDGEGFYYGNTFAFGHRRLSIIDLSENASQPMVYNDKYVITSNGEIFNYLEIKLELECLGYNFISKSDTEVILASYDYWGDNCVNKFNGMWAFSIYDIKKNLIFSSRDRYGIKPFYYMVFNDNFYFGSEIKQLLCFVDEPKANVSLILDFLVGYEEHNLTETFFQNVYRLKPSHNLIYKLCDNTFEVKQYYSLKVDKDIRGLSESDALLRIKSEFERSVNIRMRSDVSVGTCLSGGLDSSTISYFASNNIQNSGRKLVAIHAKSTDTDTDESVFAQTVAEDLNLDFKVVTPEYSDFKSVISEIVRIQEEPFSGPSLIMQYFVFKESRANNCIVLLDGQGGDEVFLGYERYYLPTLKYLTVKKRLMLLLNIKKFTRYSFKSIFSLLVLYTIPKIQKFLVLYRLRFVKKRFLKNLSFSDFENNLRSYGDIDTLQKYELFQFVLPQLLKVEDKNSMANSIETRLPFLDHKLIEMVYSVNNNLKLKNMYTKFLMRRLVENKLPDSIVWRRKKIGFAAPETSWLSDKEFFLHEINGSKLLEELLVNLPQKMDNTLMWKLYSISLWEKEFGVSL
jgi:asparagine synthase (glutamine-hydrolysing)